LKDVNNANDVDILVIYENDKYADILRKSISDIQMFPPIHLILMKKSEEQETDFRNRYKCIMIFPDEI
jgi:hypothetical protein